METITLIDKLIAITIGSNNSINMPREINIKSDNFSQEWQSVMQ
jgi:hypothetical protein